MGLRNSKNSPKSYDIAPIATKKESKKSSKNAPVVTLPPAEATVNEKVESSPSSSTSTDEATAEVNKEQTTESSPSTLTDEPTAKVHKEQITESSPSTSTDKPTEEVCKEQITEVNNEQITVATNEPITEAETSKSNQIVEGHLAEVKTELTTEVNAVSAEPIAALSAPTEEPMEKGNALTAEPINEVATVSLEKTIEINEDPIIDANNLDSTKNTVTEIVTEVNASIVEPITEVNANTAESVAESTAIQSVVIASEQIDVTKVATAESIVDTKSMKSDVIASSSELIENTNAATTEQIVEPMAMKLQFDSVENASSEEKEPEPEDEEEKFDLITETKTSVITPPTISENIEASNELASHDQIPEWVNEDNFKPLLLSLYPNLEKIISFSAKPALAAGENYATTTLRIKIAIQLQDSNIVELCYILKVAPDNEAHVEMHKNFFKVENTVYDQVIPEMEEMYSQAGLNIHFAPKVYKLGPRATSFHHILLEDLNERNYKNACRLDGLDMEHTKAVLRKLAQFHAASACRFVTKGAYSDTLTGNMDSPFISGLCQMVKAFKHPFLSNLNLYENGGAYKCSMNAFFDHAVEKVVNGRKSNPEHFNVLNHGDCWSNNILFKHTDDGEVDDVLFVDFQNTNYGSPAQDLYVFIISSTQCNIKVSQFEHLIHYYHQHLEEHLKLLKYPLEQIPSLRELHQQLIENGFWATTTAAMAMGVVLLDPTPNATFDTFIGEQQGSNDLKNAMFSNPRYIQHINELLPWLSSRGFMETNECSENTACPEISTMGGEETAASCSN
ncbi:uncharacterized protein LOC106087291 [Stomoxys calcitrans]|uniref:uncharacterized protein LOC106087291 n=1 Tax=Stomoxys calcitrans TaxID=35570 RepID=UPI0027E25671|nr:uncharacterized protein LOC106087291 [Stomoxys calcitrans]